MSAAAIADPARANGHHCLAWGRILVQVAMGAIMLTTLLPFCQILHTTLSLNFSLYDGAISWLPTDQNTGSLARVSRTRAGKEVLTEGGSGQSIDFWRYPDNSIVVATLVTVGQVFFSACAIYAFSRPKWKGRGLAYGLFLGDLMVPVIFTSLPNFVFIKQLGPIDTLLDISLPTMLVTPFVVFFLRQFFMNTPVELEEAAPLDGPGKVGNFFHPVPPVSVAPIVTTSLLTFTSSWNDYFWPSMVFYSENSWVLTVGLRVFRSQTPSTGPDQMGLMMVVLMAAVLMLVFFTLNVKRIVDSIGFGGIR